ncbi:helix-turn-helix domain-containing protein [uncultured Alsobacter sp.]|uniref:helix-turn-helix transcriptional regulator n=1 Tax=uncultured Alsobacter sp. TaxID=1748258 RepID=UPI0025DC619C|nr:helix-turn-helix domain-containing protein [uncultured Alsobacter sp.]
MASATIQSTSVSMRRLHKPKPIPNLAALPPEAFLTTKQVAQVSGFSEQTVRKWGFVGRGPKLTKVEGCPRYRVQDVRAWMAGDASRADLFADEPADARHG